MIRTVRFPSICEHDEAERKLNVVVTAGAAFSAARKYPALIVRSITEGHREEQAMRSLTTIIAIVAIAVVGAACSAGSETSSSATATTAPGVEAAN